jgi:hypothetical protein
VGPSSVLLKLSLELGARKLGHLCQDTLAVMNSHIEVLSTFLVQPCCDTHSLFFSSNTILLKCSAHLTCLCSTYTVGLNVTACSIEHGGI